MKARSVPTSDTSHDRAWIGANRFRFRWAGVVLRSALCTLATSGSAIAADSVFGTAATGGASGQTLDVPVYVNNAGAIVAAQFDVESAVGSLGAITTSGTALDGHVVDVQTLANGRRRVVVYSSANRLLASGSLVTVPLTLAQTVAAPQSLLTISNIILSNVAPAAVAYSNFGVVTGPDSTVFAYGESFTLSVVAIGPQAVTYQWRKDGVDLAGATGASFAVANADVASRGGYSVLVTSNGSTTSSPVASVTFDADAPGFYFGTLAGSEGAGVVSLFVDSGHRGYIAGYLPDTNRGFLEGGFAVSTEGSFSIGVDFDGGGTASGSVGGQINGANLAGTVTGGTTLSATRSASGGASAPIAGGYLGHALLSAAGDFAAIVDEVGRAVVYLRNGTVLDAGQGSATAGAVSVTGAEGTAFTFAADPGSGVIDGTYALAGVTTDLLGLRTDRANTSRLTNISTRGRVLGGDQIMIVGFVITGSVGKSVLLRGVGPVLQEFGVGGALVDPKLDLFDGGTLVSTNDDWDDTDGPALAALFTQLGAFDLPAGEKSAALRIDLAARGYTAHVSGVSGATGIALAEVYDAAATSASRLVNISTRGSVSAGDDVMIAGFVVSGNAPMRVLIRGIGPRLGDFGVGGFLPDPAMALYADSALLKQSVNWSAIPEAALIESVTLAVGAFDLIPGSADDVMLVWLEPGLYTTVVSGVGATSGVALVEVYEVADG